MVSEGETWVQQNGIGSLVCRRHKIEGSEEQASFDGCSASYSINSSLRMRLGTIPGREVEKFRDVK